MLSNISIIVVWNSLPEGVATAPSLTVPDLAISSYFFVCFCTPTPTALNSDTMRAVTKWKRKLIAIGTVLFDCNVLSSA